MKLLAEETHRPTSVAGGAPERGRRGGPATAVLARRVEAGREPEYERLAEEMVARSQDFPGQLAATMLHEANTPDYTLVYSFVDQRALQTWLDSAERRRLLERADQIARDHGELPALSGLETWFTLPHRATIKPPPRWKMWLASLVAVYPLVVCFQAWLALVIQALASVAAVGGLSAGAVDDDDVRRDADCHSADAAVALPLAAAVLCQGVGPFADFSVADERRVELERAGPVRLELGRRLAGDVVG